MRITLRTPGRSLATLAVAAAVLLPCTPVDPAPRTAESLAAESAARTREERSERGLILEVVRRHRRSASDPWRRELAEAILQESRHAAVDPLLVAAIVATESSFRSRAVSGSGAVGLMQLRPFVARDVAERFRVEWRGHETLHAPELNVRLGILYFKELVERFDGDRRVALAAYNRGPSRVSRELREGRFRGGRYPDDVLRLYRLLDGRRRASADRAWASSPSSLASDTASS